MAKVTVRVTNTNGILQTSGQPITVETSGLSSGSGGGGATRFDSLDDVVEGTPTDGEAPIYNSATDKYVVGPINIDGGEF
jgi:hypothetical protein